MPRLSFEERPGQFTITGKQTMPTLEQTTATNFDNLTESEKQLVSIRYDRMSEARTAIATLEADIAQMQSRLARMKATYENRLSEYNDEKKRLGV
jgi:hypothetical protein